MRVSHEAIYQSLYVQGRGALRRDLTAARGGQSVAGPESLNPWQELQTDQVLISQRPAEAEDRAVLWPPGGRSHPWSGEPAIGTLVERTTRFTMPFHSSAGARPRRPERENGPALTGHGAVAVRDAIADTITTLPEQLRRSLTWDQGIEMAQHAQLRLQTGLPIYFCDPRSPWQRATNENTNGLLRQYFPRGTDLARHSAATSPPSPPRSTAGPARPSPGRPPPRRRTNTWA